MFLSLSSLALFFFKSQSGERGGVEWSFHLPRERMIQDSHGERESARPKRNDVCVCVCVCVCEREREREQTNEGDKRGEVGREKKRRG